MTVAEVMLWGTKIGTVAFDDENGLGSFEYDPGFLVSGIEVAPIAMPLSWRVYAFPELARRSFHGLPGLLASAKNMGVKKAAAEEAIDAVQSSLAKWDSFAEAAKLRESVVQRIEKQFVVV